MPDHAISTDPAVQAQLDRLWSLSPGADVLGLARITELLDRLGKPHRHMPPAFHVAGTNGKGSTCAFLRASLEAAGYRVHAYTSPHLVRFNERIRLAGALIGDDALAPLLEEVLDAAGDLRASFFEVTTAAAFLAFARTPADACVIEVGLGGRLDATNVIRPVVCGIAGLGIDHEAFLLAEEAGTPVEPLVRIGFEKAGIAKRSVPLVTQSYPAPVEEAIADVADSRDALLRARGRAWSSCVAGNELRYADPAGELALPLPALAGPYQPDNAALAVAMLRHQIAVPVRAEDIAAGIRNARWPARMQRLADGPLVRRLWPIQRKFGIWVDGAHNESAARAIADSWTDGADTAVVLGMLANKDAAAVVAHLVDTTAACHIVAVPVPGHACHPPEHLAELARTARATSATVATNLFDAFDEIGHRGVGRSLLVAGSLYLAGEALAANGEVPD